MWKRLLFLSLVVSLVVALVLSLAACGGSDNTPPWQEQYDLGVRYLSEGNYQEAIIAFQAAIAIDPKQVDAYINLADAYIATGDTELAAQVLSNALENVEDVDAVAAIEQKQEEIIPEPESIPESQPEPEPDPEPEPQPESASLTLSDTEVTMFIGNTYQLYAYGVPEDIQVTWSSSYNGEYGETDTIIVDQNGRIITNTHNVDHLLYAPETITATYTYNGTTYSASCDVIAYAPRIEIEQWGWSLSVGDTFSAYDLGISANFPHSGYRFSSSNPSVAVVDSSGVVTVVGAGYVELTIAAKFETELGIGARSLVTGPDSEIHLEANEYGTMFAFWAHGNE